MTKETLTVIISCIGAALAFASLIVALNILLTQIRTNRSRVFADIVNQIYADARMQEIIYLAAVHRLQFGRIDDGEGEITAGGSDCTTTVDLLLSRLQVVAHLWRMKVLRPTHGHGLRYEIIAVGRNDAIRAYLHYLRTDYVRITGIEHEHFRYFTDLYVTVEYDKRQAASFARCLEHGPTAPAARARIAQDMAV